SSLRRQWSTIPYSSQLQFPGVQKFSHLGLATRSHSHRICISDTTHRLRISGARLVVTYTHCTTRAVRHARHITRRLGRHDVVVAILSFFLNLSRTHVVATSVSRRLQGCTY